jgi:polysaccharide deacetylase 2 family uncharacterized protein YibQ
LVDLPTSDLQKPLGAPRQTKPVRRFPGWIGYALGGAPFAALAAAGLYVALSSHPEGGRPVVVSAITAPSPQRAPGAGAGSFSARDAVEPAPEERALSTAGEMEKEAGVKVLRPGGADTPNSVVIRVPDAGVVRLAPAPDRRLSERTRNGILPRVGEDGARPWQVYARPVPGEASPQPRIAILLGGLGISASSTADAISRLPGEISLAFAPYGSELDKATTRARADGHEIFLQVPMEPFDYPDNDPGPHTLLTGPAGGENGERLRWVMSRFNGYVGIVNFMGGRLMSDEAALAPVLRELAERGLMVIDDGSSGRSVMASLAGGFRTPAFKADMVLDLTQRAEAIDRELARLEQIARQKGFAMASASALPLTIERVARWSRNLEQRGLKLVPVSAAVQGGPAAKTQTTGSLR